MSRSGSRIDQRIAREKAKHFLGRASISIQNLSFPRAKTQVDWSNVSRLSQVFQAGCLPEKSDHQIPAIIDQAQLDNALTITGVDKESLRRDVDYVELQFPDGLRLECLHGQHRVLAAARLSPPIGRWVVRLYLEAISEEARRDLEEARSLEKEAEDGEFYYKIRVYQGVFGERDPHRARMWWAYLAGQKKTKKDRLQQLFRHPVFYPAFDAFRDLPALYSGLRLSVVNRMISDPCHDEYQSMLQNRLTFWKGAFEQDEDAMALMDWADIKRLDCTAPGASEVERRRLYSLVLGREILGSLTDQVRERVWSRICEATKECVVPTLWGFFNDIYFIRMIAASLEQLVEVRNHSLRQSFEGAFGHGDSERCLIQISHRLFVPISADGIDRFELAYRQLWLYAMREYRKMQPATRKKRAGPEAGPTNSIALAGLAEFAVRMGFDSKKIQALSQKNPHRAMARQHLRAARMPGYRKSACHEDCVNQVAHYSSIAWELDRAGGAEWADIGEVERDQRVEQDDLFKAVDDDDDDDDDDGGARFRVAPRSARSGLPLYEDHCRDQEHMFIAKMHDSVEDQGAELSSFFIQRSLYLDMFSSWPLDAEWRERLAGSPRETYLHLEQGSRPLADLSHETSSSHLKIQEQEKELSDSKARIEELEGEVQGHQQAVAERQDEVDGLKESLMQQQAHLRAAQEASTTLEGKVQQLEEENGRIKTKADADEQALAALKQEQQRIQQALAGDSEMSDGTAVDPAVHDRNPAQLEDLIEEVKAQLQTARQDLKACQSREMKQNEDSEEKQKRIEELEGQVQQQVGDSEEKQRRIGELEGQVQQQVKNSKEKQKKIKKLKSQVQQQVRDSEEKQKRIEELEGQVQQQVKDSEENQKRIKELEGQVQQQVGDSEGKQKRIKELEGQVQQQVKNSEENQKRINQLGLQVQVEKSVWMNKEQELRDRMAANLSFRRIRDWLNKALETKAVKIIQFTRVGKEITGKKYEAKRQGLALERRARSWREVFDAQTFADYAQELVGSYHMKDDAGKFLNSTTGFTTLTKPGPDGLIYHIYLTANLNDKKRKVIMQLEKRKLEKRKADELDHRVRRAPKSSKLPTKLPDPLSSDLEKLDK